MSYLLYFQHFTVDIWLVRSWAATQDTLLIIFTINRLIVKSLKFQFVGSCSLCPTNSPKLKNSSFTIINDEEKQQNVT